MHTNLAIKTRPVENVPITFTRREILILTMLLESTHKNISKTRMLTEAWNYSFDPRTNVVEVAIFRLRKKIRLIKGIEIITNRKGYSIQIDPSLTITDFDSLQTSCSQMN